jgi:hypothetical protein
MGAQATARPNGRAGHDAAGSQSHDPLLAALQRRCQPHLAQQGYRRDGSHRSRDYSWVRFSRPTGGVDNEETRLVVLVLHSSAERLVICEGYVAAGEHYVESPYTQRTHRYPAGAKLATVGRDIGAKLCSWLG